MKQRGTYAICFLALLCLILSAFYTPDLVMRWNDYQLLQDYEFEQRNGIDYEAIGTSYIADCEERLNAFAGGIREGKQYFIASTGEAPKDWREVLIEALSQDISYFLMDQNLLWLTEDIYDRESISEWEHYVIYDSDGVAFLCWYIECKTSEQNLRLLVDAVDDTVYYAECYQETISNVLSAKDSKKYDKAWLIPELTELKKFYVEEAALWTEVKIERYKGTSEMNFKDGTLHFGVSYLEKEDGNYGIGIGIEELKNLLPSERTGEEYNVNDAGV